MRITNNEKYDFVIQYVSMIICFIFTPGFSFFMYLLHDSEKNLQNWTHHILKKYVGVSDREQGLDFSKMMLYVCIASICILHLYVSTYLFIFWYGTPLSINSLGIFTDIYQTNIFATIIAIVYEMVCIYKFISKYQKSIFEDNKY